MNQAFDAGDFIVPLEGVTKSAKAYTSVQSGPGAEDHIELNSDLVFGSPVSLYSFIFASERFFPS